MKSLTIDALLGFVPFKIFSQSRLNFLLQHCSRLYAHKGQILIEPGSAENQSLFLMSGTVISKKSGELITSAFPYALHYKYQKQDTFTALTDCSFFQIERDLLDRLLCWTQVSSYLEQDIAYQRQYDTQIDWMRTLLQSNLFYKVSPLNVQKIFLYMTPLQVRPGQKIIGQGDFGDCCYFIKEGTARVTRLVIGESSPVVLAELGVGGCVGEDALLHETVRNASVTMTSDGLLMKMDKRDFVQLLREPHVDTLMLSDLNMVLQTGAILLDVRTQEEFEYEHLAGALCMPLDLLRIKSRMLDPYKLYVTYCDSDRRSRVSAHLLEQLGIRARALHGGLSTMPGDQKQKLISG